MADVLPPASVATGAAAHTSRSVGSPADAAGLLQYKTYKVVYRRYAGLYFIFCVDTTDNELLYLETIHLFVEVCLHA